MGTQQRIGVLGLGTMGGAMARRLAAAGYAVTGYDPSLARAAEAGAAGVRLAPSPAAAADADLVLSSLPHPAALRQAYLGPDGALDGARAGMTLIDTSTVDPESWREVAAAAAGRGVDCLDAPVSGGPAEAGSGELVFLVGGEAAVLERCRPVLAALGSTIHHAGPLGSGHVVKLVNNLMSMANVLAAAEGMVLGVKAGVDPQRLFDILSTTGGRSHHFLKRFPHVLRGDFAPRFSVALSRKDLSLALGLAARLGIPLVTTAAARQMYEAAAAEGLDNGDMAGVIRLYERWAGIQVRNEPVAAPGREGERR